MQDYDVIILGAGAAGLMCAATAGQRGRRVLLLDHAEKLAEKIRISGGGRCNFTNLYASPANYLSQNPHFCKSALKRYTQHDFINLVKKHGITFHEKTLGQLFCDNSAKDIIAMLVAECDQGQVTLQNSTTIHTVEKLDELYHVQTSQGNYTAHSLVVATGGPAIPKMGATAFGYQLAEQFGLAIVPPRAGLVPFTFDEATLNYTQALSGQSVSPVRIKSQCGQTFDEALLFTHRGLSGPAVLQISSYWQIGEKVSVNFTPHTPLLPWLKAQRHAQPKNNLAQVLTTFFSKRLAQFFADEINVPQNIGDLSDKKLTEVAGYLENWQIKPHGTEGYRTAEVALGGVDTTQISSKTFEAINVPNLYFIGEVLDVTGHLGGFNFQWAWSSGWCAGQYV